MSLLKSKNMREIGARIEVLADRLGPRARVHKEATVETEAESYPIYSFQLGSTDKDVPALALVGGVHGLEVVGTQIILSYLETIAQLIEWDEIIHDLLDRVKLLFYPCVNPGGIAELSRSNPNGIDLMRNAPVDADNVAPYFLPGGHRISPRLPWYRGKKDQPMEVEAKALCDFVRRELWTNPFSMTLDLHSGFGVIDRLWFPFAYTKKPFPLAGEVYALKLLLDKTLPQNIYAVEPQAHHYNAHGDLWDYLYLEHERTFPARVFLPLSLEMGSWIWIRKNPKQIFNPFGMFHPVIHHRLQRTLRRHIFLLDFLVRASISNAHWTKLSASERKNHFLMATKVWY